MSDRSASALTPLQLFTIAFGTIVGISWVFLSGPWLRAAGSLGAVLALLLGSVAVLPIAWCYAHLAECFPGAGGELLYVGRTLGTWPGVLAGWLLAWAYITLVAFHLVTVSWLLDLGLTHVAKAIGSPIKSSGSIGDVVSAFVFGAIVIANIRGLQVASRLQDLVVALLVIATLGFAINSLRLGRVTYLNPYWVGTDAGNGGLFSVLAAAPFLFGGFGTAVQALSVGGQSRPRAMFAVLGSAVVAAAVFYSLVMLSIAAALPRPQLLSYPLPALDAFSVAFHSPRATASVSALALVALCTSWNGVFLAGWRLIHAMAEIQFLPLSLARGSSVGGLRPILIVTAFAILIALRGRTGLVGIVNSVAFMIGVIFLLMAAGTLRHLSDRVRHSIQDSVRTSVAGLALVSACAVTILAANTLWASANSSFDLLVVTACCAFFLALAIARRAHVTRLFRRGTA